MTSPRINRRTLFRTAAAGAGVAAVGAAGAGVLLAGRESEPIRLPGAGNAEFRWLGVSGWRIDIGGDTLLIDPYLTRFPVGLAAGAFDASSPLRVDPGAIDPHVGAPKYVFVTHTHWDHFNDVPHIAARSGARVFGTLTTCQVAQSYDVPPAQLSVVKGGEVLDFGGYTVEVVGSLHSRTGQYSVTFSGVRTSRPERPATIADLPEGDTLAFLLRIDGGPSVFFMGASDFVERNLTGAAPDVAMIAVNASDATHDYAARLMRALDHPRTVVPVHWDDFESPQANPPRTDEISGRRRDALIAGVRAASPQTEVIVPEYLTPYRFG
ncbi:MBL fold metallo-hydrolase [Nocardia lijiangensis]|uniref:MBL fold metallo-hydrolase n=1 Tax=Nocardia lijiangensis TaxID=299618 RepID=UPI0008328EEB|nr:MBL fold metallo-hydrolase [Nocardia lijiangensis]